jgi:hypothetical protein
VIQVDHGRHGGSYADGLGMEQWPHHCYDRRRNEAIYGYCVYLYYDWLSYRKFLLAVTDVFLQQITTEFTEVYEIAEMSLGKDAQVTVHCSSCLLSGIALSQMLLQNKFS